MGVPCPTYRCTIVLTRYSGWLPRQFDQVLMVVGATSYVEQALLILKRRSIISNDGLAETGIAW